MQTNANTIPTLIRIVKYELQFQAKIFCSPMNELAQSLDNPYHSKKRAQGALVDGVRVAISELLIAGKLVSQAEVAQRLGVKSRTLGLHLHEQSLTFGALKDDVLQPIAITLLCGSETLDYIALKTGFKGRTGFAEAFERWYGLRPTHFRILVRKAGVETRLVALKDFKPDALRVRSFFDHLQSDGVFIGRLRRAFRTLMSTNSGHDLSVDSVSAYLSVPVRSCQRWLKEEGSTFSQEKQAAQLDALKDALISSDQGLEELSLSTGFSGVPAMNTFLQKHVGVDAATYHAVQAGKSASGRLPMVLDSPHETGTA